MPRNPYDVLGVSNDATSDEIKRAYRRRSKHAHPDRHGGDNRAQQELNDAYAVLGDPERRERFDKTGRCDQPNLEALARNLILGAVKQAIEDVFERDALVVTREHISGLIDRNAESITRAKNRIARLRKRIRRLKRKDGSAGAGDFLLDFLNDGERQLTASLESAKQDSVVAELALKLLDDYSWDDAAAASNRHEMGVAGP